MKPQHHIKHILITGGCGFIGTNFVRFILKNKPKIKIINLDLLTYAGQRENLIEFESSDRYQFVQGDVCDFDLLTELIKPCDTIVHMAAESHVDRSIAHAKPFIQTNVVGTQTILDALKHVDPQNNKRLLYVSTDEVYGELPLNTAEKFHELSPLQPRSPYAASKAAGDLIVHAAHHTFNQQTLITRCSNNFGPYQYPEKIIPLFVTNILQGKKLPLYGDGLNVRDWIYVDDHVKALLCILEFAENGSIYNIGANCEKSNIELTHQILNLLNVSQEMIQHVADRLAHDRRYALDTKKLQNELNWNVDSSRFDQHLTNTINWYNNNTNWWSSLKDQQSS
ncbi:dTDP-glucose 4,6-dehydratase [Planctomycetota bacterium]|nr:dTDP-glucose 4,6-dehydratase [Planctomycetota bacterium]